MNANSIPEVLLVGSPDVEKRIYPVTIETLGPRGPLKGLLLVITKFGATPSPLEGKRFSTTDTAIGSAPANRKKSQPEKGQRLHDRIDTPSRIVRLGAEAPVIETEPVILYANGQPQEGIREDFDGGSDPTMDSQKPAMKPSACRRRWVEMGVLHVSILVHMEIRQARGQ